MMASRRIASEMAENDPPPVSLLSVDDHCRLALQEERGLGEPLHHYLQRRGTGDVLSALKVWGKCLRFQNLVEVRSPVQTLEHSFSSLWRHIRTFGLFSDSLVATEDLWNAVKEGCWSRVCVVVANVQEQLFPILKSTWSKYIAEDCLCYRACFRVVLDDIIPVLKGHSHQIASLPKYSAPKPHLNVGTLSSHLRGIKNARVYKRIQLTSESGDTIESPMNALRDME